MFGWPAPRLPLGGKLALASIALVGAASCAVDPPLYVHTSRLGQTSEPEIGKPMSFDRIAEAADEGHPGGYFAIRSTNEWDVFFADTPSHPHVPDVDFSKETIVALYASDPKVVSLGVHRAVAADNGTHLYVTQVLPGKGCKGDVLAHQAFDVVKIPRNDRAIHVHVDLEQAEACDKGAAPSVALSCHLPAVEGQTATPPAGAIKAELGQTVECDAQVTPGDRPLVDRSLTIANVAKGSGTKLAYAQGGGSVTFTVDSVGKYTLHADAVDDAQQRGQATATVEVPPPSGDTYATTAWTKFSPTDELDTFPRVELHAVDSRPLPTYGGRGAPLAKKDCSFGSTDKPSYCQATKWGVTYLTRLKADPPGRYDVSVKYVDDRFDGAPVLCVRLFTKGAITTEKCDPTVRKAGAVWDVGTVDEASGTFVLPVTASTPVGSAAAAASAAPVAKTAPAAKSAPSAAPAASAAPAKAPKKL